MTVFCVSSGVDGIISALYYSFTHKKKADKIVVFNEYYQNEINSDIISIGKIGKTEYERVKKALLQYDGSFALKYMNVVLRSSNKNAYTVCYNYAYKTLKDKRNIWGRINDPVVLNFVNEFNRVWRERHRILGFLRFSETENGVLYACYSPDNDITALITPHFLNRYKNIPFVIHDIKRGIVAVSDGKSLKYTSHKGNATLNLSEDEKAFLSLFKEYYKAININERNNPKQQNNFMPKKYRPFMPETYEDN